MSAREKIAKVIMRRDMAFMSANGRDASPIEQADAILAAMPEILAGMVKELEWDCHPDDEEWIMKRMTNEQRVEAIRTAAVSFANDYGPLTAANSGDEQARHDVAHRLSKALRAQGLSIVQGEI